MTALTMEKPVPRFSADFRKFANWALVWIGLANIPFMAMWFVGAPPRFMEIAIAGFVGLIVKRMPRMVQWTAFAAVMAYSLLSFVAGLFNLAMDSLLYSLQFFAEIKPGNSAEYIVAAIVVLGILVASWFLLKRDTNFEKPLHILLGGALIFGLVGADAAMGQGMRGHYFREAPVGANFESAAEKTGFAARADGKRHLVLIMVESLGVPRNNQVMAEKLFAYYENSAIRARYDVSQGTSLYYNSTTSGEFREMCGKWGDYYELLDAAEAKQLDCLPAQLAEKGYATHAMHSFKGEFFKRNQWYPNIGFESQEFWPELEKRGAEWCGGVFAGACDRQVPAMLAENLKRAAQPTFLYWLTLNAHLPVPTGANLNADDCGRVSQELASDFPMICRQFAIFDDIDRALIAEITASDFPEADILLVGDHMPPYFDRHNRSQFDPERVPWLYLKAKPLSGDDAQTGD
ncbi:Phosphoglycerol transferase MdoB [Parasphingorhabdus marina DSM 22363]|uniref:Phosphoglycerol transferase MdoB n=1 Tax=Parasphingorhabdus marina DSM 22363 TaxID=1123272 RepID=A0A1N6CZG1_9SPHN|nr:sulfatase-like hydrolase/transferase [Parasphingorhabdus marina]SIN63856.1 Phosphoglycerol transferase MdoB [Parasphingorhabdus marina DSM 22363]